MAKKDAEAVMTFNPMRALHGLGVRSNHAYLAGVVALALSLVTSVFMSSDSRRARVGAVLAPTLIAIGLGLKDEE